VREQKHKFDNLQLFATGFIQVYFVAVNTYFIANEMYLGVLIAAFMISLIWSFNVKKVAFGSTADRVVYALGASFGCLAGLWSSSFVALIVNEKIVSPYRDKTIETIVHILQYAEKDGDRLAAAKLLLAYDFGTPKQTLDVKAEVDNSYKPDLSKLTDEELRAVIDLQRKSGISEA
jgi:hypothetical protein